MMHKRAHHFSLLELDFNQHSNQLTANIFPTAKHSPQITVTVKDPLQIHSLPSTTTTKKKKKKTGVIIIVHFSVGDTPSKHIIIR
jgi:hypothetical protein